MERRLAGCWGKPPLLGPVSRTTDDWPGPSSRPGGVSWNAQSATIVNPPWCCDNAKHGAKAYADLRQGDCRQRLSRAAPGYVRFVRRVLVALVPEMVLHNERGLDCVP